MVSVSISVRIISVLGLRVKVRCRLRAIESGLGYLEYETPAGYEKVWIRNVRKSKSAIILTVVYMT